MLPKDESLVQAMIAYVETRTFASGSMTFRLKVSGVFPEYSDSGALREATFRIRVSPSEVARPNSSGDFFLSYTFSPDRSRRALERDFGDFLNHDVTAYLNSSGTTLSEMERRAKRPQWWFWAKEVLILSSLVSVAGFLYLWGRFWPLRAAAAVIVIITVGVHVFRIRQLQSLESHVSSNSESKFHRSGDTTVSTRSISDSPSDVALGVRLGSRDVVLHLSDLRQVSDVQAVTGLDTIAAKALLVEISRRCSELLGSLGEVSPFQEKIGTPWMHRGRWVLVDLTRAEIVHVASSRSSVIAKVAEIERDPLYKQNRLLLAQVAG